MSLFYLFIYKFSEERKKDNTGKKCTSEPDLPISLFYLPENPLYFFLD